MYDVFLVVIKCMCNSLRLLNHNLKEMQKKNVSNFIGIKDIFL